MRTILKQSRQQHGFTQAQLSEQIGIGEAMYRGMEAGRRTGNIKLWLQLSKIFNESIEVLLENKEEPHNVSKHATTKSEIYQVRNTTKSNKQF